ncbi:MAG: glycosyltransferase family 2 protein, partial [Elusimicrobia bacterium]|nr:glycosyltransferase family 2 protein [Elusimicrobiota bacterium]
MNKVLVIALKNICVDPDAHEKAVLEMIQKAIGVKCSVDFYSAIPKEGIEINETFYFLEEFVTVKESLRQALLEEKYGAVIFTSHILSHLYYRLVKDLTGARCFLLLEEHQGKEQVKEKFDSIAYPEELDGIIKELGGKEEEKKLTSIIMLTFNQLKLTKQTVTSLYENTREDYELIIVDNGSRDGTVKYLHELKKKDKRIQLIFNKENLGFSRANNQGIKIARGDYIVLLNNDVILTKDWLGRIIECAESDMSIGLVATSSNEAAGVQKIEGASDFRNGLERFSAAWQMRCAGEWVDVHRLNAFCLLIKRDVIDKIGMLDENFGPGGYEDYDYCLRARQRGYRIVVARSIYIHHIGGQGYWPNNLNYDEL